MSENLLRRMNKKYQIELELVGTYINISTSYRSKCKSK